MTMILNAWTNATRLAGVRRDHAPPPGRPQPGGAPGRPRHRGWGQGRLQAGSRRGRLRGRRALPRSRRAAWSAGGSSAAIHRDSSGSAEGKRASDLGRLDLW